MSSGERLPAWARAFALYWTTVRADTPSEDKYRSEHRAAFRQGWIASGLERARRIRTMRANGTRRTRPTGAPRALKGRKS